MSGISERGHNQTGWDSITNPALHSLWEQAFLTTSHLEVCCVISSGMLLFTWRQEQARGRQIIDGQIKSERGKHRPGGHFGHIYKTVMRHSQFTWQIPSATLYSEWRAVGLKLQQEEGGGGKHPLKEMRLTWCCKEIRWRCEKDTFQIPCWRDWMCQL